MQLSSRKVLWRMILSFAVTTVSLQDGTVSTQTWWRKGVEKEDYYFGTRGIVEPSEKKWWRSTSTGP